MITKKEIFTKLPIRVIVIVVVEDFIYTTEGVASIKLFLLHAV